MKKYIIITLLFLINTAVQAYDMINTTVLTSIPPQTVHCPYHIIIWNNLKDVLAIEGCKVISTKSAYFVRDAKILSADNNLLRTSIMMTEEIGEKVFDRLYAREKFLKHNHAMIASQNLSFKDQRQGMGIASKHYYKTADGLSQSSHKSYYDNHGLCTSHVNSHTRYSRSYLEGGNIIHAVNNEGKAKILIGQDTLIITHQLLRLTNFFGEPNKQDTPSHNEEVFFMGTFYKLSDQINIQYKSGEVLTEVIRLGEEQNLTDDQIIELAKELNAMGLIAKYKPNIIDENLRQIVIKYVGQLEYIKQILWPYEFAIDKKDIVILPQAAYHLDVFMNPGLAGNIFLQDFASIENFLKNIMTKEKLSHNDLLLVKDYIDTSKKVANDFKNIYENIENLLTGAGFNIIKTPGAFYSDIKNNTAINFMNALIGYSEKNNYPYYVCLGAQVGDNLGVLIMDEFKLFMQQHVDNLVIHFVGNNDKDFTAAMFMHNEKFAGVHCLTYELERHKVNF